MDFNHTLPIQIRFNDVDLAQHVNNAVYQEYFDLGRVSYFGQVIGENMDFTGLSLVIASFKVDFFQPVFLNDKIEVKTSISSIGNKSLEMKQQIIGVGDLSVKAESVTVMVCYNYTERLSVVVPEDWREKIKLFEIPH